MKPRNAEDRMSHRDTEDTETQIPFSVLSVTLWQIYLCLFVCICGSTSLAQTVNDPNLVVQQWATGFDHPTGMAFLPDGRALVLEKETGKVQIMRKQRISGTALDLPVANDSE